jgi:hypothetical protein
VDTECSVGKKSIKLTIQTCLYVMIVMESGSGSVSDVCEVLFIM